MVAAAASTNVSTIGALTAFRQRLRPYFSSPINSLVTMAAVTLIGYVVVRFYGWAWADAVFSGTAADCRKAQGACWAFIAEKAAFDAFGLYPHQERWRPAVALLALAILFGFTLVPRFWSRSLLIAWLGVWAGMLGLMAGGFLGLSPVPMRLWGGLPVTMGLAVTAIVIGYPAGLALALGRRSPRPVYRILSVCWIEFVRGVPLVSILVMTATVLPLFLPEGATIERLVRAQIAFAMFASAYLAEVFRGGFQSVPKSQFEASAALGLSHVQMLRLVVLPQVLVKSLPGQVNTVIAVFKDTTLVLVIGIFDFFTTIRSTLSDTAWLGFTTEAYLFGASFYFVVAFGMSRYSQYLERRFNPKR